MSKGNFHHPHNGSPRDEVSSPDGQQDQEPEFESTSQPQQDDLAGLYDVIAKLTEERDQAKDQSLRTVADMQNLRRRFQQEKEALQKFAAELLVRDLLPVLDNFERTIAAAESGASKEALLEGVQAVDRQLRSVLEARSLERISSKGQVFDPEIHEAVAAEETLELPEGTVTQELAAGYKIGDAVIRPAKVRVAKKP